MFTEHSPKTIWINKFGDLLVLHGRNLRGNWVFETEEENMRETVLHPKDWEWDFLDFYEQDRN